MVQTIRAAAGAGSCSLAGMLSLAQLAALIEMAPVLIANNTAFRGLEKLHAGWDLPVDDVEGFRRIVTCCAAMPQEQWHTWSDGARRLAATVTANQENKNRYRLAFQHVAARRHAARAA